MNKLIIAAAGAGKTRYIVEKLDKLKDEKVLVTTFTNANESELKNRIIKKYKCIPPHITVQSWWSFLLQHGVRPYQGYLYEKDIKGMFLANGQSGVRYIGKSGPVFYKEDTDFEKHYFTKKQKIYSDKISKLTVRCDDASSGEVIRRLSSCFSYILIDEVQDLSGYDLELLKKLLSSSIKIILVGDPRQGTYSTSNSAKNKKFSKSKIVNFFEDTAINIDKDDSTLNYNYRCTNEICNFSNMLYPDLPKAISRNTTTTGHDGIFFIKKVDVSKYLEQFSPMQLKHDSRTKVVDLYSSMNFGASKGMEFDRVIIYPTKPMTDWIKDSRSKLQPKSRASFYVALTRARQSIAIISDDLDNYYNPE